MADVLPSCTGMEGLLYLLFSGFVQANKSHKSSGFQLVRINPSVGVVKIMEIVEGLHTFPLVLLQAKAVSAPSS
jgi:hypothetical protein